MVDQLGNETAICKSFLEFYFEYETIWLRTSLLLGNWILYWNIKSKEKR